jgi:hypothetical protein
MEDVIIKTLLAAQGPIYRTAVTTEGTHDASFELYGFDLMLDSDLRPWLIEVNTLPSLESSSGFDYNVKSTVVTDLLNLAQVQLFDRYDDVYGAMGVEQTIPAPRLASTQYRATDDAWGGASSSTLSDIGLFGTPLSPMDDCADTIARVQDERAFSGGFRQVYPIPSRVPRLSRYTNEVSASCHRTDALNKDVARHPEKYATTEAEAAYFASCVEGPAVREGPGDYASDDAA